MARFVPNGQVTLNSKIVVELFDFDMTNDNGLNQKATLARRQGIPCLGMSSCEMAFSILVTNEQLQVTPISNSLTGKRDEIALVVNADAEGTAAAFAGLNCTADMTWGQVKVAAKLGEGVVFACTMKGSITETNM